MRITRRLFLSRSALVTAAVATAASASNADAVPTLSSDAFASIAAWQTAQRRANAIWQRYCTFTRACPERDAALQEWRAAYEVTEDALSEMLRALHVERVS